VINNVNNFAAAKVKSPQTPVTGQQYNYLIDLLSHAIKILSITSAGGISVGSTGLLELGNELEALQVLSDAAGFVKKSGDGAYAIDATEYEPHDDDLTAIAAIAGTDGYLKKTAENTWALDAGSLSSIWGYM